MQDQISGIAGFGMFEVAQPLNWQAAALREYERSWPITHADLRTDLAARILRLTGRRISRQEIYTDGHLAVAGVDGATFRLY